MSTRSRRNDSSRARGGSGEISLYVALTLIVVAALALAYLALSGVHIGNSPTTAPLLDSTIGSSPEPSPTPAAEPSPAPTSLGFLGGSTPAWWINSVDVGLVPGVSTGPQSAQAGLDIAGLTGQLGALGIEAGQSIVIQVGSQDIIEGASAAEIDASMRALWQGVKDQGARPIAALIPPSNVSPGSVVTVNNQIRASALEQGIAVLDVTTAVSAVDGTWSAEYSDDGLQPNAAGTSAMVLAAVSQLPLIISSPTSGG